MAKVTNIYPTLIQTLWQSQNIRFRNALLVVLGSLALWLSAKVQVPFYPVPMTMQTFIVLLIGMAFGWRLGTASVILYILEGALGLPVFAGTPEKGIGIAYIIGPTGGYLFGFVICAATLGMLSSRGWDRNIFTTLVAMIIGMVIIYTSGLFWLGIVIGWDKPILEIGLLPFLLGDSLKIALATAVLPLAWKKISYSNKNK